MRLPRPYEKLPSNSLAISKSAGLSILILDLGSSLLLPLESLTPFGSVTDTLNLCRLQYQIEGGVGQGRIEIDRLGGHKDDKEGKGRGQEKIEIAD